MKKMAKIAFIAVVLMGIFGGLSAAVKNVNWYSKTKMSFDITGGWIGASWGGLGVIADFDYALLNWSWGFGPINLKVGGLASIGYSFGYTVLGYGYGGGINFAIGPVASVDWALGSVLPDVGFLNKLSFSLGLGVGFYFSSLSAYLVSIGSSGYSFIVPMQLITTKYHMSETMALVLQESWLFYETDVTFGVEFKF